MPDIDVYIDSKIASGNNWQSFVPTMFEISPLLSGTENIVDDFTMGSTLSGANSVQVEAPFDSPGYLNVNDSNILFTTDAGESWYRDTTITNEIGITYNDLVKILNDLYISGGTYGWTDDVETEFGVNENTINILNDSEVAFKIYIGSAPAKRDTVVDLTLSDDVYFYCGLDMFSTHIRGGIYAEDIFGSPAAGEGSLFVVATSVADDAFFTSKNLVITKLIIDLYRIDGELKDIVSLFYVNSHSYAGNLEQTLEYTGAFSGVTDLFGSKEFQVAFVGGDDYNTSSTVCTASIKSSNTTRMYSAVGIGDRAFGSNYYDPNYIIDVDNAVYILYNTHIVTFTNPPELYDADTKEILFHFRYAMGRIVVLIDDAGSTLSATPRSNCYSGCGAVYTISVITYGWLSSNYDMPTFLPQQYLNAEVLTSSGVVYGIYEDMFSTVSNTNNYIPVDMFICVSGTNYIDVDIDTALGNMIYTTADIYSTVQDTTLSGSIPCDIRTWSMFFGDFFLDIEDFTTASSTAWVDVVDYMWPIDQSESYFLVDGQRASVTFSGIDGGQRMFYDPPDDFYSDGTLTYTAHFQNSMGDVMEREHYLLYGYDLDFVDLVDWGAYKKVEILAYAKNKAFCPNKGSAAFYFVTRDYDALNLRSMIRPLVPSNLGSVVSTQSTAFYYGSTYKITVSGIKDFAGNYLEPFEYRFTIEDPTS